MNLPSINFTPLSTHSYEELLNIMHSNPLAECFLVYFRCKYTCDTKWEYIIDTCNIYYQREETISWFNDWYEGQQNIEYLAVAVIELPE